MDERDRKIGRRSAVLGLAAAGLLLAGCGRRSSPKAPDDSTYKDTEYPTRHSMGLPPKDSMGLSVTPPAAPVPVEDDDLDLPPTGAYSAPPRGMRR